jgi:hypothetical protein
MYQQIKKLADEALALQNKDRMDAALREISGLCDPSAPTADVGASNGAAAPTEPAKAKKGGAK